MSAEALIAPLLLAAAQLVIPLGHPRVNEAPRAPIETSGPLWFAACDGSHYPDKAAPPVRIHGNSYLVGTCGHASMLIVGENGDVLIVGSEQADADLIADNIRELGYSPANIRYILDSGADPAGLGKLQRMSGATVVASAADAATLRAGSKDDPAVPVGRIAGDGDEVRLGNILVTAIASPPGSSWRWESCDGGVCRTIVYGDLTPGDTASAARMAASPCEILVTADPKDSDMPKRLVMGAPLFDRDACKAYATAASAGPVATAATAQPK